ncbi:unnamed protein product, partial [Owenia fusiformis]
MNGKDIIILTLKYLLLQSLQVSSTTWSKVQSGVRIIQHNDEVHTNITSLQRCKELCETTDTLCCRSIEWNKNIVRCNLSKQNSKTANVTEAPGGYLKFYAEILDFSLDGTPIQCQNEETVTATSVSESTVQTTQSENTVQTTQSESTIQTTQSENTVQTTPSESKVQTTPSESTFQKTPSESTVQTTPNESTVQTTQSESTVQTTLSESTTQTTESQTTAQTTESQTTAQTTESQTTAQT